MPADWLLNWAMVFLRASGLLVLFPVFAATQVPVRVRTALAALLAFLVSPALPPVEWAPAPDLAFLVLRMIRELGTGLLFGWIARLLFYALEIAGTIISQEIGLNLPGSFDPMQAGHPTVPGAALTFLGSIVFLGLDMHHWLIVAFQRSFEVLPVGGGRLPEAMVMEVLGWVSRLFVVALQLSAPLLAVSFILSLVFSVLGRAVSQMNVFTESFSVRLISGLAIFGASLQLMAQQIANYLHRLPDDVIRVATLLGR